jgi:hypothetical protein
MVAILFQGCFHPEHDHEAPKLQTVDDRLARIEDLLVKVAMRLDRIEQQLSKITVNSGYERN